MNKINHEIAQIFIIENGNHLDGVDIFTLGKVFEKLVYIYEQTSSFKVVDRVKRMAKNV